MYITPQPYKCLKCSHEFEHTPDGTHSAPVLSRQEKDARGSVRTINMPVCPVCYAKFLMENVGIGYGTTVWFEGGSDYDKASEKNVGVVDKQQKT